MLCCGCTTRWAHHVSVSLSVCLSVCLYLFVCRLSACRPACRSASAACCLHACLCMIDCFLSACLSVSCLYAYLFVCRSVRLSLSLCLYVAARTRPKRERHLANRQINQSTQSINEPGSQSPTACLLPFLPVPHDAT